jgi:hypothetical protein
MGGITLLQVAARGDNAAAVRAILEGGGGGEGVLGSWTVCLVVSVYVLTVCGRRGGDLYGCVGILDSEHGRMAHCQQCCPSAA